MFFSLKNTVFFQRFAKEICRCSHFFEKKHVFEMILRGKTKKVFKNIFFVFKRKRVDKKLKNTKNSKKNMNFHVFLQVDHPSVTGSDVGENGGVLVFWFLVFTGGIWLKTWKSVMIYLFSHRHLTLQKIWGGSSETSIWNSKKRSHM